MGHQICTVVIMIHDIVDMAVKSVADDFRNILMCMAMARSFSCVLGCDLGNRCQTVRALTRRMRQDKADQQQCRQGQSQHYVGSKLQISARRFPDSRR